MDYADGGDLSKIENPPKEIPLKTEMCQLIFYDFTVK